MQPLRMLLPSALRGTGGKELANDLILGNHWENIGTRRVLQHAQTTSNAARSRQGSDSALLGRCRFQTCGRKHRSLVAASVLYNLSSAWSTQQQAALTEAANAQAADDAASAARQMVKDWQRALPVNAARLNGALPMHRPPTRQ